MTLLYRNLRNLQNQIKLLVDADSTLIEGLQSAP